MPNSAFVCADHEPTVVGELGVFVWQYIPRVRRLWQDKLNPGQGTQYCGRQLYGDKWRLGGKF
jgi:hypothetical protein